MILGNVIQPYRLQITPDSFDINAKTNYLTEFEPATLIEGMYLTLEFPSVMQLTESTSCPNTVCTRIG
jgi:hypothetical protein